jgi:hypothetical protein
VEETFFSFPRLNAMFSQMLDVAILFILVIPFKRIPYLRHQSLLISGPARSNNSRPWTSRFYANVSVMAEGALVTISRPSLLMR